MKEYLVTVPVVGNGTQTFTARANSLEQAIDVVGNGGGTFLEESYDVQNFKIDQAKAELNE